MRSALPGVPALLKCVMRIRLAGPAALLILGLAGLALKRRRRSPKSL